MATEHLLMKALKGGKVSRPPVWMMRQAGRYLPDFMALKEKYDFFTRVQTPELACEITLQPVEQIGVDAAILFSDILVVPQAMGLEVEMIENKGPFLPFTVNTKHEIDSLRVEGAAEKLEYVSKAITLTQKELDGKVPLIGFAGAPFTLLCYMVEGRSSKTFDKAKQFCFSRPDLAHELLSKITEVTLAYLEEQVKAGVDAIQVFDSWSGLLGPKEFNEFALPYLIRISDRISPKVPVILFPKGSGYALDELSRTSASAIGVDWCIRPEWARKLTGPEKTLQGNMDPCKLLLPIPRIRQEVKEMIDGFGCQRYIANLGHGILPNIPVDNAKAFVEAVKNYTSSESL